MADLHFTSDGTMWLVDAETDEGLAWLGESVQSEPWQWLGERRLAIDWRFAADLAQPAGDDGLVVLFFVQMAS